MGTELLLDSLFEKKMKKMVIQYILRLTWIVLLCLSSAGAFANAEVAVPLRSSSTLQTMFRHPNCVAPKGYTAPAEHAGAGAAVPVITYRVSAPRTKLQGQAVGGNALRYQGYATPAPVATGSEVSAAYSVYARRSRVSMSAASLGVQTPRIGRRKVYHAAVETDGNGNYWDDEAEDWLPIPGQGGNWQGGITEPGTSVGQTLQGNDGKWYMWNGTDWVLNMSAEPDSPTPVGDLVWWLWAVWIGVYAIGRRRRYRKQPRLSERA